MHGKVLDEKANRLIGRLDQASCGCVTSKRFLPERIRETRSRWCASLLFAQLLGSAVLLLAIPAPSLAWGPGGHMMTAYIAFDRLSSRARQEAQRLLAVPIGPDAEFQRTRDFVSASHWADDIRRLPGFEFSADLHFVDNPFKSDATSLPAELPKKKNVISALEEYVKVLQSPSSNDATRVQALRFIIHFVGDLHQPLHAATRVSAKFPHGDLGGNNFCLEKTTPPDTKCHNLHSHWDEGLGAFPKMRPNFVPPPLAEIPPAANAIRAQFPDSDARWRVGGPFNFRAWMNESFAFAKNHVYVGLSESQQPTPAYDRSSLQIAEKRIAWGGYRLAALLNAIWP